MRSGTTPAHDWANFPEALDYISDRLQGVVIESKDATEAILRYDSLETLHYVDPPYVHSTRKRVGKGRGYRHEMTDVDHRALAGVLHDVKGAVVLSGYPSALYEELYRGRGWRRIERSAWADGASKRTEVLWVRSANSWRRTPRILSAT